ncbi:putative HC-toxin efflux carrier TOXA [Daldinia childiae]|uniref:putative HC-toxin efflux carrier TOXA n=1 Tax=Daldinia childiae TaxID=326645 RepID=UPI001447024A|nr:putative HC-toxin efflux carrier TOXA [Daldinia childiae]KAF3064532.1 putative HC-toxin efflux carrier TOXA [Daldinia childiae]
MGDTNNWQAPKAPAPGEEGYMTSSSLSFQEREKANAPNADTSVLAAPDAKNPDAAITTDSLTSEHTLMDGAENKEYVTGYKLALLLFSVTTFFFLLMLDMSIISTAVPQITSDFHSLPDIGWYSGAYQLAGATLQPLTGKLYTRVSAKWVFLFFFFIFEVGSLICAVSQSSVTFIIGRAVAGVGSSGLQNGSLTVIAGAAPLDKQPMYVAFMMAFGQIGLIAGPLIGGVFTQYVTWRWCFYINLPLGGLAGLFLALMHVPDQTVKPRVSFKLLREVIPQLDLIGFAIFAPSAVMLLLALQFGSSQYPWNSSTVIGLFVGAGVTFPIFLWWERRQGDKAMLPFSMIGRRIVWVSALYGAALMTSIFVGAQFFPIYFQSVKGVGPTMSGVDMLPSILSSVVFILVSGALLGRFGYYLPWGAFAGGATAVAAGMISMWGPDTTTAFWIGTQILYGARGCGIQIGLVALQNNLPPAQSALGVAFLIFCQNFSAAVFSVVANTIFQQTLQTQIKILAPSIDPAMALAAGGSAEAVRALAPPDSPELRGVLLAFSKAFDTTAYLLIASASLSFVASWGMGWVDVRKKKQPEKGEA